MKTSELKILIALQKEEETSALQEELEYLGHRTLPCTELNEALQWVRRWQPDLIITEEQLGREQPDAGLRLAEYCRVTEDRVNGWPGTRTVLSIPVPDWDRFKRAQRTCAHVIVKGPNFGATIRYVLTIADNIVTDRILGPALVGMHRFKGDAPSAKCENCEWIGGTISYESSQTDLQYLTPVRIGLLNVLLFRQRGQSSRAIANVCDESRFLQKILRGHVLRESAVKMEATRLRRDIEEALAAIGAPYTGEHFLPFVPHGTKLYCLAGNRRLMHIHSENLG
jgi:hypothetical protein